MELNEYLNNNEQTNYLPEFIKDFHDQKSFFKALHFNYRNNANFNSLNNSWVENQIFTIDVFLYFMAMHGYKLQKIRNKNIEFLDIEKTLKEIDTEIKQQQNKLGL